MTEPVLTAENLTIGYAPARQAPHIVAGTVSVSLHRGEFVCLLGPNGAGKSTLMRTLVGMQPPLKGCVYLSGQDVARLPARDLSRKLSVVLTDRVSVGILAVRDLVALGRYPHTDWTGRLSKPDEQAVSWAIQAARAQHLSHRNVAELSDGERQKAMIARALAQEPELMVLDEPTAFLDLPRRVEIMALLKNLAHTTQKAILLSTHDLDLALRCADCIWLMPAGGPIHVGAPEDLILNGAFEAAFDSDGVRFDADTGAFKNHAHIGQAVGLSGHGRPAFWTARALERAGFQVNSAHADFHIEIFAQDQRITWCTRRNGSVREHHSVYDLIAAMQKESWPAD